MRWWVQGLWVRLVLIASPQRCLLVKPNIKDLNHIQLYQKSRQKLITRLHLILSICCFINLSKPDENSLTFFAQVTQNTTFIIPPFTVCWLLQVTSEVATKVLLRLFTMQAGGGWYHLRRGWDKAFSLISPTGLITLRLYARLPLPPWKCLLCENPINKSAGSARISQVDLLVPTKHRLPLQKPEHSH